MSIRLLMMAITTPTASEGLLHPTQVALVPPIDPYYRVFEGMGRVQEGAGADHFHALRFE